MNYTIEVKGIDEAYKSFQTYKTTNNLLEAFEVLKSEDFLKDALLQRLVPSFKKGIQYRILGEDDRGYIKGGVVGKKQNYKIIDDLGFNSVKELKQNIIEIPNFLDIHLPMYNEVNPENQVPTHILLNRLRGIDELKGFV